VLEIDVMPLLALSDGQAVRFCLSGPDEMLLEIPADYEAVLRERLAPLLTTLASMHAEVDLAGIRAVSSCQLGALVALQKVLRPHFGRVPIVNVGENVRHLLAVTHVDRLFDVRP
jgi:anti-anti-sigma regulatory factor